MAYRSPPEAEGSLSEAQAEALATLERADWIRVVAFEPGELLEVRSRLDPAHLVPPGCLSIFFLGLAVAAAMSVAGAQDWAALPGQPGELGALLLMAALLLAPVAVSGWWGYHRFRAGRGDGFRVSMEEGLAYSYSEMLAPRSKHVEVEVARLASAEGADIFRVRTHHTYGRSRRENAEGQPVGEDRTRVLKVELRTLVQVGSKPVLAHSVLAPDGQAAHPIAGALRTLLASFDEPLRELSLERELAAIDAEHSPESSEAHQRKGGLYHRRGRLRDALSCFERATALAPDDAEAWAWLANVATALEPPASDKALAAIDRAIALRPEDSTFHAVRSTALLQADRRDDAIQALETSVSLSEAEGSSLTERRRARLQKLRERSRPQ